MGKKGLIAITLMTLMSAHATNLDNHHSGYSATDGSRLGPRTQDRGISSLSGARSNVGSIFNTRNPTFNSVNQVSSGSFGTGGSGSFVNGGISSIVGSLGSANQGARGSGFNFGSTVGLGSPGYTYNAAIPGLTFTGFRNFGQIPPTYRTSYGTNSVRQGSRPLSLGLGPFQSSTTSRLRTIPSFTSSSFGTGSSSIKSSFGRANSQASTGSGLGSEIGVIPTSGSSNTGFGAESLFGEVSSNTVDTTNSQPSSGSEFGSEFNVNPTRGSFKGPNLATQISGISQGNLQSLTRFTSEPFIGGSQGPSQISSDDTRFNSGSSSEFNSGSTSGLNSGSTSEFNSDSTSGFNSDPNSRFNTGSSGFNAGLTSFNIGSSSGFNAGLTSFNIGSTSGFNPGSTTGFNSGSTTRFNTGSSTGINTGSTSGSSSFDFGQNSGITDSITPSLSRGYLPPSQ